MAEIRHMKPSEIDAVAEFISAGYFDDIFFKWCVPPDEKRQEIVTGYYKAYLSAEGAYAYVAEENGEMVGAAVWLPHDVDAVLYDEIDAAVKEYAPNFRAVADRSHENEPKDTAFTQLVGFVVDKNQRGKGFGIALLDAHLTAMDKKGIPTYLEASTPYHGGGVYGKFGFKPYGNLMHFSPTAVLYPLWRDAPLAPTAFVWHESFFWHNAGDGALYEPAGGYVENLGQAESPESKRRVKNLLERSGLIEKLLVIKPMPAKETDLLRFHTKVHIDNVRNLSSTNGGLCGDSTMVGRGSYDIAALAAGGAITAVEAVVRGNAKNAYALTRPPGHHAMAHEGMGYCIFNNAAIAVKYAQEMLGVEKILIVDWDAHHGNGTEDAFYSDPNVLFISLHQDGLEPMGRGLVTDQGAGAGEGFTVNIPLPAGSGDAVYAYAFEKIVMPRAREFAPQLVIVSAGQDANIFDPLARMMLSAAGYRHMIRELMTLANGRTVCIHEGGYCASYVPFCTHGIIEELSGITTDVGDPFIYAMAGTGYDKLHPHQKEAVDKAK